MKYKVEVEAGFMFEVLCVLKRDMENKIKYFGFIEGLGDKENIEWYKNEASVARQLYKEFMELQVNAIKDSLAPVEPSRLELEEFRKGKKNEF